MVERETTIGWIWALLEMLARIMADA